MMICRETFKFGLGKKYPATKKCLCANLWVEKWE